jgi:hypothetical protein
LLQKRLKKRFAFFANSFGEKVGFIGRLKNIRR